MLKAGVDEGGRVFRTKGGVVLWGPWRRVRPSLSLLPSLFVRSVFRTEYYGSAYCNRGPFPQSPQNHGVMEGSRDTCSSILIYSDALVPVPGCTCIDGIVKEYHTDLLQLLPFLWFVCVLFLAAIPSSTCEPITARDSADLIRYDPGPAAIACFFCLDTA